MDAERGAGMQRNKGIKLPAAQQQLQAGGRRGGVADEADEGMAGVVIGIAAVAAQVIAVLGDCAARAGQVVA